MVVGHWILNYGMDKNINSLPQDSMHYLVCSICFTFLCLAFRLYCRFILMQQVCFTGFQVEHIGDIVAVWQAYATHSVFCKLFYSLSMCNGCLVCLPLSFSFSSVIRCTGRRLVITIASVPELMLLEI